MQLCFLCSAYFLSSVEFPHRAFCSESPSSPKMSRTIMAETLGFTHCYGQGDGRSQPLHLTFVLKWLHSMRTYEEKRRPSLCPHRGRSLSWADLSCVRLQHAMKKNSQKCLIQATCASDLSSDWIISYANSACLHFCPGALCDLIFEQTFFSRPPFLISKEFKVQIKSLILFFQVQELFGASLKYSLLHPVSGNNKSYSRRDSYVAVPVVPGPHEEWDLNKTQGPKPWWEPASFKPYLGFEKPCRLPSGSSLRALLHSLHESFGLRGTVADVGWN